MVFGGCCGPGANTAPSSLAPGVIGKTISNIHIQGLK
jgi:hypothetical protein